MSRIAAILFLLFACTQANALVVRYDYRGDPFDTVGYGQGEVFNCADHPYECQYVQPGDVWTGSITIDHGAAPDLRGKTLALAANLDTASESYTVGSLSASGPYTNFGWIPWLDMTGIFAQWQPLSIYRSDLFFNFDRAGNITCWGGYSFWGGDGDPGSDCGYDYLYFTSDVRTSGPGTWTTTLVAAVPLPASGLLFLSALGIFGALGFAAARRKGRAQPGIA